MKLKSILLSALVGSLFFGCASSNKHVTVTPVDIPDPVDVEEEQEVGNGIYIHGMTGPYPESYKGKILGRGLFNHVYFTLAKRIEANVENTNSALVIQITTKSRNPDIKAVVKEGKNFFKQNNNFQLFSGIKAADVVINVSQRDSLKFEVVYENPDIFNDTRRYIYDMARDINTIADESNQEWSSIYIPGNEGTIKYSIMKDPVTISEYNPKKLGKKPVTNIAFADADEYCFNKYGGYLTPIYVFEYALRQGAILPPSYGVSSEMISGYDEENPADKILHKDGDIVTSSTKDGDFSEIVIFNYKSKRYSFKRDSFRSKSVTFRCAK